MDRRRLSREPSLQKRAAENRRKAEPAVPDITDLMDAMFFGTVHNDNKQGYNVEDEEDGFDDSTTSRMTQEWLEEARRLVASSPSRSDQSSPVRFGTVSPRFVGQPGRLSSSGLDRRDPLSRSARRHRSVETISGEILSKTVKHSRNRSSETALPDTPPDSPTPASPASAVQQWLSNILKPHHNNPITPPAPTTEPTSPSSSGLPPRQPPFRRSRFTKLPEPSPVSEVIPLPNSAGRSFHAPTTTSHDKTMLSPPKTLLESARTRFVSSSTCSLPEKERPLSPPKNLVQSAHRRSLSKSTCSLDQNVNGGFSIEEEQFELGLNGFLKEQRLRIKMIADGEIESKARIVLSGPSNSTSSMAAAICYAWLMEKKAKKSNEEDDFIFVPVMSLNRGRMWKQRQAAWLFHHVALDTSSLIFSDEVDLESLMMCGQLNMLVVGEDILQISGQVGSSCTILTDNFCEDAYDLLQSPIVKNLLLAGILLDTQNLRASGNQSMGRDAEAVQLLLVGSPPNSRALLFDQLMQDQRDQSFFEVLRHDYGKPRSEKTYENKGQVERNNADQRESASGPNSKTSKTSKAGTPTSGKHDEQAKKTSAAAADNNKGKNKFFLAKWFGFGQK